jgi:hypothetical protein
MKSERVLAVILACGVLSASALFAAERHMMQPLVPADKLAEARALASPLPDSAEIVEKGKAFYNGKGTCFTGAFCIRPLSPQDLECPSTALLHLVSSL